MATEVLASEQSRPITSHDTPNETFLKYSGYRSWTRWRCNTTTDGLLMGDGITGTKNVDVGLNIIDNLPELSTSEKTRYLLERRRT